MRAAITLAFTALVFVTGCQRSTRIVTTSHGEVYFITGGRLYGVHGNTMTPVLAPPPVAESRREKYVPGVREFDDSIPSMDVRYRLKLKAFGPADVRYILTVESLNDSAVFSGPRSCWLAWTQSVPYLQVDLEDADGFRVGEIAVGNSSERIDDYNPKGPPKGFEVDGLSAVPTEAILAQVAKSSPMWRSCSKR